MGRFVGRGPKPGDHRKEAGIGGSPGPFSLAKEKERAAHSPAVTTGKVLSSYTWHHAISQTEGQLTRTMP